jgi:hypothetical protein
MPDSEDWDLNLGDWAHQLELDGAPDIPSPEEAARDYMYPGPGDPDLQFDKWLEEYLLWLMKDEGGSE